MDTKRITAMRRLVIRSLLVVTCSFTLSGALWAQDATLAGQAMVSDEGLASMDSGSRQALVGSSIAAMRGALDRAKALLEKTRSEERDVLKLNCINEKIAAMKGFLKVAERAQTSLQTSIASGASADEMHQTRLVMIAATRVQVLGEETETCAGEIVQYHGATTTDYEVDGEMRTDNPTNVDTSDVDVTPLPDASPYH